MLSKLIKQEFRATSRIMWPVFLGMLALTALMRFSQLLLNGGHIPWLLQLIGVLLVIGFMMGLGALAFVPLGHTGECSSRRQQSAAREVPR